MCGRYVSTSSPSELAERFLVDVVDAPELPARYNVSPRAGVYAVVARDGERHLEERRWGLVPSWAEDPGIGDRLVNARAESLLDKPAFRKAFARRRCLLPADGFYEWKPLPAVTVGGRRRRVKQPYYFHGPDGAPLGLAGLWEAWRAPGDEDGPWLLTCAIVTTAANPMMAPVHDRMPVVLAPDAWGRWLDPASEPGALTALLAPPPDDALVAHEVGTRVNDARNEGPDLVSPVGPATLL